MQQLTCDSALNATAPDEARRRFLLLTLYRMPYESSATMWSFLHRLNLPQEFATFLENESQARIQETELARYIEQVGTIADDVSRKVAEQYEVYPYPRWCGIQLPTPWSRMDLLRKFFAERELAFTDRRVDILVAGCGTGERATRTALAFADRADVLAFDLSRRSLAHASRMAQKYGVRNVRFIRMDILDIDKLERGFDVIECLGVLHHMAEPIKGWRRLVERLRPGGVMNIHVYSKLARREIAVIRTTVEHDRVSADYIRECRYRLMTESPDLIDRLAARNDFFGLSRCKDLLFNVQEHHFTIEELGQCLEELKLEFRGLEVPEFVRGRAWLRFPHGMSARRLDVWAKFEEENPDAFKASDGYVFWCRKP